MRPMYRGMVDIFEKADCTPAREVVILVATQTKLHKAIDILRFFREEKT